VDVVLDNIPLPYLISLESKEKEAASIISRKEGICSLNNQSIPTNTQHLKESKSARLAQLVSAWAF
jgi:hypothetical protein